jgi:hypothetical protein
MTKSDTDCHSCCSESASAVEGSTRSDSAQTAGAAGRNRFALIPPLRQPPSSPTVLTRFLGLLGMTDRQAPPDASPRRERSARSAGRGTLDDRISRGHCSSSKCSRTSISPAKPGSRRPNIFFYAVPLPLTNGFLRLVQRANRPSGTPSVPFVRSATVAPVWTDRGIESAREKRRRIF